MKPYMPCGTTAGAKRHYRAGEKPCAECLAANRQAKRIARNIDPAATLAIEIRQVRNGLPPFRPYRYQGTGRDAYDGSDLFEEAS